MPLLINSSLALIEKRLLYLSSVVFPSCFVQEYLSDSLNNLYLSSNGAIIAGCLGALTSNNCLILSIPLASDSASRFPSGIGRIPLPPQSMWDSSTGHSAPQADLPVCCASPAVQPRWNRRPAALPPQGAASFPFSAFPCPFRPDCAGHAGAERPAAWTDRQPPEQAHGMLLRRKRASRRR